MPRRLIAEAIDSSSSSAAAGLPAASRQSPRSTASTPTATTKLTHIHHQWLHGPLIKENAMRTRLPSGIGIASIGAVFMSLPALCGWHEHAVGAAAPADSRFGAGSGRQDRRRDHHHRHRPDLAFGETAGGFRRLIQIVFGISIAFAASSFFLSFFSFGGGALRVMSIEGFEVPLHRSLTEPILLAGAPRAVAIVNGTIAAALGLGLRCGSPAWSSGWSGIRSRSSPPSAIPQFAEVLPRHLRQRAYLAC